MALSVYRTDPLILDVGKEMLCALVAASGEYALTSYVLCVPQIEQWLKNASTTSFYDNHDVNCGDSVDGDNGYDKHGLNDVPASLIDVGIGLLSKVCISHSLPSITSMHHTQTSIILECLRVLIAPIRSDKFICRREAMQAINRIFSYYEGEILGIFSEPPPPAISSSLSPTSLPASDATVEGFSMLLAEIILQSIKRCEADPGSNGESAGPTAGLLCHLIINFKEILDVFVINSLLNATLLCVKNTSSSYVRYSLLMGLIHLFARNASLLANSSSPLLGFLPNDSREHSFHDGNSGNSDDRNGRISALGYVLEQWCTLHLHLTSRYLGSISTIGLLELIKIFSMHATNHGYALKVMRLALSTLPRILLNSDGTYIIFYCYGFFIFSIDHLNPPFVILTFMGFSSFSSTFHVLFPASLNS